MEQAMGQINQIIAEATATALRIEEDEAALAAAYNALTSLVDRMYFINAVGDKFLPSLGCYCPHLSLSNGREICLQDNLYWGRNETRSVSQLIEMAFEHAEEDDDDATVIDADTPYSTVLRDALSRGFGSATYDW